MDKKERRATKKWLIMKAWLQSVDPAKVKKAKEFFKKLTT